MPGFDSHCHLDFLADPEGALSQAREAGIRHWLLPGTEPQQWQVALHRFGHRSDVSFAAGHHPWFLPKGKPDLSALRRALSGVTAAIGEIGLDFHPARLARTARATQEAWFDAQLQLAAEFERPVVIHSVKAHDRVAFYLKRYPSVRGVIHAFKGPPDQARVFVDKGWMLGCGSLIARSSKTLAAFAAIPPEAIVLETDAPDMRWPDSTGTQTNPLLDWWLTAERLAAARQMPVDELARITCDNAQRLFGLHC